VADTRRKAQSSKVAQPVPVEFRQLFVQHGWERVNHLFGKRASVRYFTVLGGDRLRAERDAYKDERKSKPAGRYSSTVPISVQARSQGAGA
jgi:hypothetical protein